MKDKDLYESLLFDLYNVIKKYNNAPSFRNEDELSYNVDAYNILARRLKLKEISWTRDDKSNLYLPISVLYIPCGEIKS